MKIPLKIQLFNKTLKTSHQDTLIYVFFYIFMKTFMDLNSDVRFTDPT